MKITEQQRQKLANKIEEAFKSGSGHYFMQKNNFEEIISVSAYLIDSKERDGYTRFYFDNIRRTVKETKAEKMERLVSGKPINFGCFMDEYRGDAHSGL